jgi:glutamate/aspartate transport system substrate-binding protein
MKRGWPLTMTRLALALMALLVFETAAQAAPHTGTLKKIHESKTIVLGYRDSSWPFSYVGADGKPAGYSVDLCLRIAEAVQAELGLPDLRRQWVKVTPEDRISAVSSGRIDIECGSTTASLSRQALVDFTLTTFIDGGSLLATDASGIEALKDLGGKRVAVIPGTTTEGSLTKALHTYMVSPQIVAVKDHAEGLAALEKGTADAYASDRLILIGLGRRSKDPTKLTLSPQMFSYEPYGFMLRRGDADFRLTTNRALSRLFRSEDIGRLYTKWFGDIARPSVALLMMYAITAVPE